MRSLIRLGCVLGVFALAACGTRAPSSPTAWLNASIDLVDGRDTSARFRMWIELQRLDGEQGPVRRMQLERRGDASSRDAGRFHIEAETQAELFLDGELISSGMIRDTQIGDGETRWLSIARPDGQLPALRAHALDGAAGDAADPLTQTAAPIDLDPLSLLRLYAKHADWVEELASEKRYVMLIGSMTDALDSEIKRRGSGYLPDRIRLSLDRDSALPIELEIIADGHDRAESGSAGKLKIRYLAWTVDALADSLFTTPESAPPDGQ